jgi:hypothetical protein
LPATTSQPAAPAGAAEDGALRFAAALKAREATPSQAGPFADTLAQRQEAFHLWGSEISTNDFSATADFTNPTQQTDIPWDVGFAFHQVGEAYQATYVDSEGFWYYAGTRSGFVPSFDAAPGATNTIDLIVKDNSALFGVNGDYVATIDLTQPTTFGVYIGTGFIPDHRVEGREVGFSAFQVWPQSG